MFKKTMSLLSAAVLLAAGLSVIGITAASAVASNDASLNVTTSKIKGVSIGSATATTCLDGLSCATYYINQVVISLSSAQAGDTSNSGSFVTGFVPTDSGATVNKIVRPTYSMGGGYNVSTFNSATAFDPTSTIGTQDNLLVKVTAADGTTIKYYGFKFSITYPPATLSASSKIKGVTITDFGTPNQNTASVVAGSITISSAQAADTSNSGSYVTSFVNSDSSQVTPVTVRKAPAGTALGLIANAYNGTAAIVDGDIFLVFVPSQSGPSSTRYAFVVTVTAGGSSSSSSSSQQSAQQAAESAAYLQAVIAKAKAVLSTQFSSNKPATADQFLDAGYGVRNSAVAEKVSAAILKLPVADRDKSEKINEIINLENFIDRVAVLGTRTSVTSNDLVSRGLLPADSVYKYSVVQGLANYPDGSLNSMEKIAAAVKAEIVKAGARKAKTEAIKAKIAARRG